MRKFWLTLSTFLVIATPAEAYIGPGLGAGTISAVLGVVGAILLALFAILYYPIKRILKTRKSKAKQQSGGTGET